MRRYSAYMDSEIEWVGEVPAQWSAKPLFSLFRERQIANEGNKETNVLSLSYGRIIRRDVESNFGLLPESFETYNIVESLNIVMRLTDLQNDKRSLRCGLVKEKGIITSAYLTLEKIKELDCKYMYYLLHYYDIRKVFYSMGGGVRQVIKFDDLKRLPILLPSLNEQKAVASYLDRKTTQINDLIVKKEQMIELLQEERKAIINQAVTKGLDPIVEMKDSGIEWLGEIPKHWKSGRMRFSFFVASGNGFPDELQGRNDGEYPFYKVSDINLSGTNVTEANNYVSKDDVLARRWRIIPKGSILLAKIGAALAKNHRKMSLVDCLIDNNMMAVTPSDAKGHLKYHYYLMSVIQMEWFSNPGAVPSVDMNRFLSFSIPNIEHDEQKAIADYLDQKLDQIDSHVVVEKNSIELLKEYGISLISEVVTGKIDIRN